MDRGKKISHAGAYGMTVKYKPDGERIKPTQKSTNAISEPRSLEKIEVPALRYPPALNSLKVSVERDVEYADQGATNGEAKTPSPTKTSLWGGNHSLKRREHLEKGHFPLGPSLTKQKIKTVLPALLMIQKQAKKRKAKLDAVQSQGRDQRSGLQFKLGGMVADQNDVRSDESKKAAITRAYSDKIKKLDEIATIGRARYHKEVQKSGRRQFPQAHHESVAQIRREQSDPSNLAFENASIPNDTKMDDDKNLQRSQAEYRKGVKAARKALLKEAKLAHALPPGTTVERRQRERQQQRQEARAAYQQWEASSLAKLGENYGDDDYEEEKQDENNEASSLISRLKDFEDSPAGAKTSAPAPMQMQTPVQAALNDADGSAKKIKVYRDTLRNGSRWQQPQVHRHRQQRHPSQSKHIDTPAPHGKNHSYGEPRPPRYRPPYQAYRAGMGARGGRRLSSKSTSLQRRPMVVQPNGMVVLLSNLSSVRPLVAKGGQEGGWGGEEEQRGYGEEKRPPLPPRPPRPPKLDGRALDGNGGLSLPTILADRQLNSESGRAPRPPAPLPTGVLGLSTEIELRSGLGPLATKMAKVWRSIRNSCLSADVRRTGVVPPGAFRLALSEQGIEVTSQQVQALAVVSSKGELRAPGGGVYYNTLLKTTLQHMQTVQRQMAKPGSD